VTEPEITPANLRRAPAERAARAVLPVSGLVWGAAEIMHACAWPGSLDITLVAATGTAVAYGVAAKKGWTWRLPSWTAFGGAWMAFAVNAGPLAGWPYAPLTWGWGVTAVVAWKLAHRHEAVVEARENREARIGWLETAKRWGLSGSHLLDWEWTRLGERYVISSKGTGKRASAIAGGRHVAELIAEDLDLPVSRVQVTAHAIAGRVVISVRHADPWENPIPHPVLDAAPEIDLSGPYSITQPAVIGQDPETGKPLAITLWGEDGGKNVSVVAMRSGGKTVLLNCTSERIAKAHDAIQFRVNLSVKGPAEAERWGPACHLTAFGPHQAVRAVRVLAIAGKIIEWRAARYATSKYVPTAGDPAVEVIIEESDSARMFPAVSKEIDNIATKGREHGVNLVRAGQRGTQDYGSAKTRSQDDVVCVGKVNRDSETYHAAGRAGYQLPDMASYGQGRAGVWAVTEPGAGFVTGRSFDLDEPADVRAIVAERAHWQPDLHPECRQFLGETYEILLSTDVYARWALTHPRDDTAPVTVRAAAPPPPGSPGTAVQPGALLTDDDYLRHLDKTMTMDPADNAAFSALDAKLAGLRKTHEETAAMRAAAPDGNPGKEAEMAEARWEQAARQTEIPPLIREQLFTYLAGEGMSGRRIVDALAEDFPADKPTRNAVMLYLNRLRYEKKAYVHGKAALARWRLVTDGGDGS
jgi:hypothetical protein